ERRAAVAYSEGLEGPEEAPQCRCKSEVRIHGSGELSTPVEAKVLRLERAVGLGARPGGQGVPAHVTCAALQVVERVEDLRLAQALHHSHSPRIVVLMSETPCESIAKSDQIREPLCEHKALDRKESFVGRTAHG